MILTRHFSRMAAGVAAVMMAVVLGTQGVQADVSDSHQAQIDTLSKKLSLDISKMEPSPVPGLMQIYTERGLFYVSENGDYFLQARVYNISNGIEDETEIALKQLRLDGVKRFKDSAIEFKANNEKYVINVFTDTTCGYCRKLHNEMDQLNELGITVRYLAWPRQGLNSQVYRDTVSIWCAENPKKAISDAKAGQTVASASCENKVAEQYKFGQQIGVNGTPNIVLPDGSVIGGYKPAQAIAAELKSIS